MYGIKIVKLNNSDVPTLVRKYGRFPSDAARFCTDQLKIKVGKDFYKKLAQEQGQGFEVWLGMRKAESSQREKRYAGTICDDIYPPHLFMPSKFPKLLEKLGVMIRLGHQLVQLVLVVRLVQYLRHQHLVDMVIGYP